MKIRTGFVSNSLSSSFLIYGIEVDLSVIKDMPGYKHNDYGEYEFLEERGLQYWCPYGSDEIYIGESWDTIGDNETGGQFKERVRNKLQDVFGDVELKTLKEAWHD